MSLILYKNVLVRRIPCKLEKKCSVGTSQFNLIFAGKEVVYIKRKIILLPNYTVKRHFNKDDHSSSIPGNPIILGNEKNNTKLGYYIIFNLSYLRYCKYAEYLARVCHEKVYEEVHFIDFLHLKYVAKQKYFSYLAMNIYSR